MKITLYHGSTLSIEHPLAKVGRADLDFGRGFYLTSLRSQAEQWAARVQLLRASTTAWINVYEFDMDAAIKAGFKLLRFDAYDQHWLNFIVASRNGKQPWKDYDIIEGGVANDRVIDTIEDYLNDIITIEQALGQLVYAQPNHQICLLNQQLIDTYLHFDNSFPLDTMDRKISRIVLLLSARLEISPERALNLFYETNVCAMLHDSRYGLHLMSDTYIINDVLRELQDKQ